MASMYELFLESRKENVDKFVEISKSSGTFEFSDMVKMLQALQNQLNLEVFNHWFGNSETVKDLDTHLAEKFVKCGRNLLQFFNEVDPNIRFFMLYELKQGKSKIIRV